MCKCVPRYEHLMNIYIYIYIWGFFLFFCKTGNSCPLPLFVQSTITLDLCVVNVCVINEDLI